MSLLSLDNTVLIFELLPAFPHLPKITKFRFAGMTTVSIANCAYREIVFNREICLNIAKARLPYNI